MFTRTSKLPLAMLLLLGLMQVCLGGGCSWWSDWKESRLAETEMSRTFDRLKQNLDKMLELMKTINNYGKFHVGNGEFRCTGDAFEGWLYFGGVEELDSISFESNIKVIAAFPFKCDITKYLEEAFSKSEASIDAKVKGPLYVVLNETFIEELEASDPHKPIHHFGSIPEIPGEYCFYPGERSFSPVSNALERVVKFKDPSKSLKRIADFDKLVKKHLIKPCSSYWQILDQDLFHKLNNLVDRYLNHDWTFISEQSNDLQLGIFRYQFCKQLEPKVMKNHFVQSLHNHYAKTLKLRAAGGD